MSRRRAQGLPLKECPSNDGHNVDAIDGLVVPITVLLAGAHLPEVQALHQAVESVRVTRNSRKVEAYVGHVAILLKKILAGQKASTAAQETAAKGGLVLDPRESDPVVACYIDQNYASLLHFLAKYDGFEEALLANANAGGENVHRG